MEKPSMIKPALIGGVILGVLAAIPFLNLLCCAWMLVAGVVAAWIYIKNSPIQITSGNGAAVGALAGFVGGIIQTIFSVVSFVVQMGEDPEAFAEKMRQATPFIDPNALKMFTEHMVLFLFVGSLFTIICAIGVSALGGMIGVAIFEKRKGAMPQQPSPYPYGQPPGAPQPPQPPYPPYPPSGPGPVNPPPPQEPPQPPPQAYDKPEEPPEGQS